LTITGTSELFPLALEMDGFDLGKGSEQSQRTAFGKQLGKQRDRVIGDYRVVLAGKAKRANRWQLVPIGGPRPPRPCAPRTRALGATGAALVVEWLQSKSSLRSEES